MDGPRRWTFLNYEVLTNSTLKSFSSSYLDYDGVHEGSPEEGFNLYHISYAYMGTFGMLTTIIISMIVASIVNKE